MSVYVDGLQDWGWRLRGQKRLSCHLIADSLEELIEFAVDRLGMKEEWLQRGNSGVPHFDLTGKRRKHALSVGAIELGRVEFVMVMRRIRVETP